MSTIHLCATACRADPDLPPDSLGSAVATIVGFNPLSQIYRQAPQLQHSQQLLRRQLDFNIHRQQLQLQDTTRPPPSTTIATTTTTSHQYNVHRLQPSTTTSHRCRPRPRLRHTRPLRLCAALIVSYMKSEVCSGTFPVGFNAPTTVSSSHMSIGARRLVKFSTLSMPSMPCVPHYSDSDSDILFLMHNFEAVALGRGHHISQWPLHLWRGPHVVQWTTHL
jgi:hypothetical protein